MGVEEKLLEASGFEPRKNYADRQDYLAAVLRSTKDISDKDFDELDDDVTNWINDNAKLLKAKKPLKDFPEVEEAEADAAGEAEEAEEAVEQEETENGDSEDTGEEDAEESDDSPENSEATEEDEADPPEEKPAKAGKKATKKETKKPEKAKPGKPGKEVKAKGKEPTEADAELDKYGVMVGTKTHQVLMALEKGTTMKDLKDEFGATFYNKLKELAKAGHHVDKDGSTFRLIHKDEYGAKAKGKKK